LRGIVGSAARDQHDQARAAARKQLEKIFHWAVLGFEGAVECGGLLADLFQHFRHVWIENSSVAANACGGGDSVYF
jgi:hypothetical protein